MSDWQLDNKEWMKQRKRLWREVKFNIDIVSEGWINIDKTQKKHVEHYFLTGDKEALKTFYIMFDSLLIELWFYPSDNPEKLRSVFERHVIEKKKYSDSTAYRHNERNKFMGKTFSSPSVKYKGISIFTGRERLIDQVFMPQTLMAALALEKDKNREDFIRNSFLGFSGRFEKFFERTIGLEYDICFNKVCFWREALLLSFNTETEGYGVHKDRPEFKWFIIELDAVIANPENYQSCQVDLANEIIEVLNEPEIAALVNDKISDIRAEAAQE
ncbi:MAG: hypothetical protein WBC60_01390 [Cognaticolwellia sp.]